MNHFPSFLVDILDMVSYEVILILQCNLCRPCYHCHSSYSFCVRTGLVTDDDISMRESKLRESLHKDTEFRVKDDSVVEVAQVKLLKWLQFMSCSFIYLILLEECYQCLILDFLNLQYNPPFTLPFTRRNEIALEVERNDIAL